MELRTGTTALVEYAAGTTIGSCRAVNEDAFGVFEDLHVFVVADGCGGRTSSRSAADLTVASFGRPGSRKQRAEDLLVQAVIDANEEIFGAGQSDSELRGKGSATCALRLSDGTVALAHVGDCRVGLHREGRFAWLTEDHSLVAELRKRGASAEELSRAQEFHANVITRAVGVTDTIAVDLAYHPARAGDIYLLCSDGLTRQVADRRISAVLAGGGHLLRDHGAALLQASEAAGGRDNATVILVRVR